MSEIENQDTNQESTEAVQSEAEVLELPGRRLRETRESQHLSRDEVAHHLRLDVQLIIALEDDQYARLPSPAYICGYLRSYARLLKLPETEIVQAYNRGEQINADLIPSSVKITPKKPVNTGLLKTIVILVVLVLLGAGVYYAIDKYKILSAAALNKASASVQQSTEIVVPPAPDSDNGGHSAAVAKTTDHPIPPKHQDKPEAADDKKVMPANIPPVTLNTGGKTTVEKLPVPKTQIPQSEPIQSNTPGGATPAQGTTAPAPQAMAASASTAQSESTAGSTAAAATAILHLHFNGDSWVEVSDSTHKRLVYRLVEKNSDLNLDGVPPFTILLGNAQAVQVFYKGQEFDHANYHRDQVAYFRVGKK